MSDISKILFYSVWLSASQSQNYGSVQVTWFYAKAKSLTYSLAVPASALLKQFEKLVVLCFMSWNTLSALFRFPCRSYLKSKPCLRQDRWSEAASSTGKIALSTSCFLRSFAKNWSGIVFILVALRVVCSDFFDSGSTATYNQYYPSLSPITISQTAAWFWLRPASNYRSPCKPGYEWWVELGHHQLIKYFIYFKMIISEMIQNIELHRQSRCRFLSHKI